MQENIKIKNPYTPLRRFVDFIYRNATENGRLLLILLRRKLTRRGPKVKRIWCLDWDESEMVVPNLKSISNPRLTKFSKKHAQYFELERGETAVDVGACMGDVTIPMLYFVGKKGRVIAIEPDPRNIKYLRMNVAGNDNCTIIQKAVSDRKGTALFGMSNHGATGSEMIDCTENHKECLDPRTYELTTVETDTLDNLLLPLGKIDFLKIDVQGFEVEVLNGSKELLKTVPKVVVETHGLNEDALWPKIKEILIEAGYEVFVTPDRVVHARKH